MRKAIKKTVSFVLVFMLVFSLFTILPSEVFHNAYVSAAEAITSGAASSNETYSTDEFTYTLTDEYTKVQILSYIGSDTDVVIPDRIDDKKVTSIAERAFYGKSITSVVFGEFLESIGNYAFARIGSLESVEFPDSLKSIGNYAFTPYSDGTYYNYVESALKTVTFGTGLKTIGNGAFYDNRKLTSVEFKGAELTSIGSYAFYNTSITELNLTGNNASIGNNAFYYCQKLEKVNLTSGFTSIGNNAFQYCKSLNSVNLCDSITALGTYVFYNCTSLESIDIPDGVKTVPNYAFAECTSLKTVSIGSGCTSISPMAFNNDTLIEEITVDDNNTAFSSVDGVLFNKDKTSIVLYPKNKAGDYVIPDTVTAIAERAFDNSPKLTGITIGANVTNVGAAAFNNSTALKTVKFENSDNAEKIIGNSAFSNCTSITDVDLGNAVKTIQGYAFYHCISLSSLNLGDSVQTIGEYAFARIGALESVEFPDSLESIGNYAFTPYSDGTRYGYVESALKTVTFGAGLKTVGFGAFFYNSNLASVEFKGTELTSIGSSAFYNTSITELNLTGNNASIGNNAFYYCQKLKKVNLTSGFTSIGNYAFQNCTSLNSVNLCDSLTSLGTYVFYCCTSLESIDIPDGVKALQNDAIAGCTSLKAVSIGSGCTSISSTAFYNDTLLEEVTVDDNNTAYSSVDGALFNKDKTSIVLYPKNKAGDFVIPDTVTAIAERAFESCPNLTGITIGANVQTVGAYAFNNNTALKTVKFENSDNVEKTIGNNAFSNCTSLSAVDLGNAVKTIGGYAFYYCLALSSLNLSDKVQTIGEYAFARISSLESVEFPGSLESIGDYAFKSYIDGTSYDYVGSALKTVTFGTGLKTIGYGAFYDNRKLTSVEFKGTELTSIGSYAFCNAAITELNLTGNNAAIDYRAFQNCQKLEKVNLTSGFTSIGNYAFQNCTSLNNVNLCDSLTSLGEYIFYGCKSLENIDIPDGVKALYNYALAECTSLKTVSIGSGCTSISPLAFYNDTLLEEVTVDDNNTAYSSVDGALFNKDKTSIVLYPKSKAGDFVIPDTVTAIAERAFESCPNLTGITIGANVQTVGAYAFNNNIALKTVKFENSDNVEKTIGNYAFSNCTSLTDVDLGNAVKTIQDYAFYHCLSLSSLKLGDKVKTIGQYAFARIGSLESVEFPDSLERIENYAFTPYSDGTRYDYVESALKTVTFGAGLKTIGYGAFYDNRKLTSVEFKGAELTSIGSYAFYNSAITELILTGNNASIGYRAFYNCQKLEKVNLSNDIISIDNYAFAYCSALNTIVLGKGLTSIGTDVFYGYSRLTVYCYEDTYAHTYATGLSNVEIKFVRENYFVVDLKTSALSNNSATISWKKPYGYDTIDHYIISKNGVKYDETSAASYTDINLESGSEYVYGVCAVDTDGIISEEKTITVIPSCTSVKSITLPNGSSDIGGLKSVKLIATMENSLSKSGGSAKFQFSSDGESWIDACTATAQANGVDYVGSWSLKDVKSGEYTLRFIFTDKDGGQSYKDTTVNVDRTHPAAIDEVTITPTETSIKLSWQISVEADTNIYRIYRRAENELTPEFELISEIRNRNTLAYTDSNVEDGLIYYYYIVGTDKYGQESLTYDVVSAGIKNDIDPPQFIKMTPASNSIIYGNTTFTVTATDNVGVTKTELYYTEDPEAPIESWKLLDSHNGSSYSQRVDTSVMPSNTVYIKAKLYDAVGNSSYSTVFKYLCDNQGPEKVKNVQCIAIDGTTATLSWDNVSDNDISYFIVEQKNADDSWKSVAKASSALGVNLSGLVPETSYTYRVIGYDTYKNRGTASDEITINTLEDTIAPKVTRFTPAPGYYNSSIPLQFTATDDYQVASIDVQASTDKKTWSTISDIKADSQKASCTFSYTLDISKYEEGSLYVRGIVTDSYGNKTADDDITCYEYVIDRTAPAVPSGIKADSSEEGNRSSFVCISWNAITDDSSFGYYRLYKSTSEDGEYTLIKNKLNTVNTYDTDVEFGATYYYKLESVDLAGNVSEKSAAVACKVADDTEIPVILPVSPVDGTRISGNNNSVTIAASDNAKLKALKVEYKTNSIFSGYTTLREINNNSKNNCSVTVSLPVDSLDNGTEVTLRVTASDFAGNNAEEKLVTYIIDKEAPEVKDISLSKTDDNIFTAKWSTDAEDTSYFYIYRKRATDSSFTLYDSVMAVNGKTSYSYTDDEITVSDKNVQYRVEAHDAAGNTSYADTEVMSVSGTIKPVALLDCQSTVVCGSEYIFDGSVSTDDGEIVSYSFDFGDGSDTVTNTDGKAKHIYTEKGKYTLALQVTDNDGNVSEAKKTITVTGRELLGTVYVTVKDDNGNVLPNTDVYADLGEEYEQHAYTNSSGMATFELSVGTHIIASYKNSNYLPVKQSVAVTGGEIQLTLVLINEPIVTGEFEIHKMTFDEIVAAGIDINAAENRNVVRIDVTLVYEKVPIQTVVYWNGVTAKADPVYVKSPSGEARKLTPYVFGGGSSGSGGSGGGNAIDNPIIVYIDVPVEFSYLKEFFDVSLHIMNHASEDFSLLDNTVKLNVPNGLTLVQTNSSESKATVYINEIKGQTKKTVNWVLRGDKPGSYEISADYLGMLSYFNEPVSAKFVAEDKIEVQDASSIKVEVEAAETSYGGRIFYNTVIENNGNYPLDAFKWNPLIESFCDEFVDASGNSYEMDKQVTTLKPGEKFVYHYFTEVGGMYEYIGNMIEDMNSLGAQVNVTTYPPEYFLDTFRDKFPEESGAFVFYVRDKDDNPITGATVELSSNTSYTTDDEGRVIIEEEERDTVNCSYLKVTANGYYSYFDNSFKSVKFGKSTTVSLYKEGEFAVDSVLVDGKDATKYTASIQTNKTDKNDNPAAVTFISKIYGEIKSVDVVQNNKVLKPESTSNSSLEHTYTATYSVDQFAEEEQVMLKVTENSGEEHIINLKINAIKFEFNPEINLPDSMTISLKDCSLDWLSDLNFELAFSENVSVSQTYDPETQTVAFGINIGLGKDSNDYSLETTYEDLVEEYEKAIKDMVDAKSFRSGINSGSAELDFGFSLGGALVFKVNDDGSLGPIAKSKLFLGVSAGCEYGANFWVGYIPLTMSVGITVGASTETSFVYNDTTYMLEFDSFNLNLKLELELSLGIGISCCSFGAYGDAGISTDIVIDKSMYVDNVTLSGEFGLYVKFFFFNEKFPLVSGSLELYKHSPAKSKSIREMVAAAYDEDSYSVNNDLLSYNSVWNSAVKTDGQQTTLIENAYSGIAPQFAACDDKIIMVYQAVDSSADCAANALALYYSVYDADSNSWSAPSKLDNNTNADMAYSLTVCNDEIYIVYTQSNKSLSNDLSISEALKNIDVYAAAFDSNSNKFGNASRLTDNDSYEANPVVKNIGGVPTAVWINSASNNPFLTDNANSIMMSRFVNGEWTDAEAVVSGINAPINCELIDNSSNGIIIYTTDSDNNLSTSDDRAVVAYSTADGSSKTLAEGVETAVETGTVLGKNVVMWYADGSLMQYDAESGEAVKARDASSSLANGFEIASDDNGNYALVYVEGNSSVSALYLDTESGKWSAPITIASSENNIENLEAEYINGKLTITYYDTKLVDIDEMTTESSLVALTVSNTPKPEITSAKTELDKLEKGEVSQISVDVTNNSSEPTGNLTFNVLGYDGSVIGTYTTENTSLSAGESGEFKIPFTVPETVYDRDITVTVTDIRNTYTSSYTINLAYTDMTVSAEQYNANGQDYIKAIISNNLCYDSFATLEIYNRDTNEVLYTTNVSSVSKDKPATLLIPLNSEYIDSKGYVSVRVSTKAADYRDYNNTDMFAYFNESKFDKVYLVVGDVNRDDKVTVDDVTFIQKYIACLAELDETQQKLADVNQDGTISILDATLIQFYLSGNSEKGGHCGEYYE